MTARMLLALMILQTSLNESYGQTPADPPVKGKEAKAVWKIPVLVLRYFPLTKDKKNIDKTVTSVVGEPLTDIKEKCDRITRQTIEALEQGSRFRAYKDPESPQSLKYEIVDQFDYCESEPRNPKKTKMPDYNKMLNRVDIKKYIEKKGVKEVWIWGYHSDDLALWESNMSSPFGDLSNSDRDESDLPIFKKTYVVYHYNYARETSEAVHNHIHQIEIVLRHHGGDLWKQFEGVPGKWRCGNCHFPPNGTSDYDWANKTFVESDIEDWKPAGFGRKKKLNCDRWNGDSLKWFVYWMQSIPGKNNKLKLNGVPLSNWWQFIGDYDYAKLHQLGLLDEK